MSSYLVGETKREVGIRIGEHKAPIDAIIKKDDKEKIKMKLVYPVRDHKDVLLLKNPQFILITMITKKNKKSLVKIMLY